MDVRLALLRGALGMDTGVGGTAAEVDGVRLTGAGVPFLDWGGVASSGVEPATEAVEEAG